MSAHASAIQICNEDIILRVSEYWRGVSPPPFAGKCRQHRQQQTPALLRHLRSNPQVLLAEAQSSWGCSACCLGQPFSLGSIPSGTLRSSDCQPAAFECPTSLHHSFQRCPGCWTSLSERLSWPLPKLSNGKSCLVGLAGLLSCCDMLHIMLPWKMAAVTRSGSWPRSSPASSTAASALVYCRPASPQPSLPQSTKKAAPLDAANYRPIAVGEPLYRLYTIILNKRLVGWSEEHQLRSPVQAGFRPGQSTKSITSSPCATSLIQLASQGALCMPALWTSRRPMILSQHPLLWGQNWSPLGWGPRMLAAIRSLYSSGTLSMKVAGTAGGPRIQQMGVRQGCPLSPTLFGLFFDGLHDHLHSCASASGIQLRSGKWVSSLVYADDVVLLSWSASGLQVLLDSMDHFCVGLGLVISTTKTEVVVFNGPGTESTWRVGAQVSSTVC